MEFYWLSKVVCFIALCVWGRGRGSMCECMCACLSLFLRIGLLHSAILTDACCIHWYCGMLVPFSDTVRCLLNWVILMDTYWIQILMDTYCIQWYCQMLTQFSDTDGYLLHAVMLSDACWIQWYWGLLTALNSACCDSGIEEYCI